MSYKAVIAKLDKIVPITGANTIQQGFVLGESVIVSKNWNVGDVGIFFTSDCQLSNDFCHYNNLFRDPNLNSDKDKKGFFDDNRRVRCQKFLNTKSEGFFCELTSLDYIEGLDASSFVLGMMFDSIGDKEICRKYYSEKTLRALANQKNSVKKVKKAEAHDFYKHVDTEQFKYYVDKIPVGALLSFHAKVHGTSFRASHSLVKRNLVSPVESITAFLKKIKLQKFTNTKTYVNLCNKVNDLYTWLSSFRKEQWEYLTGTRNVVLFEDQTDKIGFHGSEQYRFDITEELKPYLEKGMTIYGEIAGFVNDKPIMGSHNIKVLKNKAYEEKYGTEDFTFKYGCGKFNPIRWHIYRITYVNADGKQLDFTDQQVQEWCDKHGFLGPVEAHEPFLYDGNRDWLVELVERLTERPECLTEDYIDPSHISEGIIIRVDHTTQVPVFYKNKSYAFKVIEGIIKESGEEDLEEVS